MQVDPNTPSVAEDSRLIQFLSDNRLALHFVLDAIAWVTALFFGTWIRLGLEGNRVDAEGVLAFAGLAVFLQLVLGYAFGLYRGRARFGSFDELAALAATAGLTALGLFALDKVDFPVRWAGVPLSASLGGGLAALVMQAGTRYVWRLYLEHLHRPSAEGRSRLLVFGAGEAGSQVITVMLRDPNSPYVPVALLDDDRRKRNLRIMGVHVEGDRSRLIDVAQRRRADELLIAIPSATRTLLTELTDRAAEAGLKVKVLPPVAELFGAGVTVGDIRPVTEADLLGRHEVDTDVESIAGYLTGKRVLVTGAGGSIGSELCRQIHRYGPAALIMLDRDESALLNVQLSIDGRGLLDASELVLADITNERSIRHIFDEHRPHVVFHAAALKHVPLLERHPAEAIRTNVWGTLTVLEAAADSGVERFVNISTDKAADPSNVLGTSKRVCERLTAHFAGDARAFISVRFGNVLGSRGSVLETFRTQIAAGGPVTVTHPEVTRFFMTVEEAVQLVIQAGALGDAGQVLVLDMGDPVRIADVAKRLVAQSDRPIQVDYTGLRLGEKLHEALFAHDETDVRPRHDLISQIPVAPMNPELVRNLDLEIPRERLAQELASLAVVGSFTSAKSSLDR